ncbi:MAG: hypothetical protein K8T90_13880 [Planctomycetes bacterium]|nr:hypothetical protein [Planctomycetota bacterium]
MRRTALTALVAATSLSLAATEAFACPNCKASVGENDLDKVGNQGLGMNMSIYFMLIVVLGAAALIVRFIAKTAKRFDAAYESVP